MPLFSQLAGHVAVLVHRFAFTLHLPPSCLWFTRGRSPPKKSPHGQWLIVLLMREHFVQIPAVDPLAADVALDEVGAGLVIRPLVVVIPHG
jgi:hypothetical protein